jgi:predicted GNAT family acetyltransferase
VRYENNEIVTSYFIEKDNNIKVQPGSHVSVHPNHRRKGIATAMFKYIEKLLGKNTIPGILTPAGKMFWLDYQRNLT